LFHLKKKKAFPREKKKIGRSRHLPRLAVIAEKTTSRPDEAKKGRRGPLKSADAAGRHPNVSERRNLPRTLVQKSAAHPDRKKEEKGEGWRQSSVCSNRVDAAVPTGGRKDPPPKGSAYSPW